MIEFFFCIVCKGIGYKCQIFFLSLGGGACGNDSIVLHTYDIKGHRLQVVYLFEDTNIFLQGATVQDLTLELLCHLCATSFTILSSYSFVGHYLFQPNWPSSDVQVVMVKDSAVNCNAVFFLLL